MHFLFSVSLVLTVVGILGVSHLFQVGDQRIRQTIGFDNALIRTGEKLVRFNSELRSMSLKIARWDREHHSLHFCGHCRAADKAKELDMHREIASVFINFENQWRNLSVIAEAEARKLGTEGLRLSPREVPVEMAECPVCGEGFRLVFPGRVCVFVTAVEPSSSACVCTIEGSFQVALNANELGCYDQ